jgi:hypothetical protein
MADLGGRCGSGQYRDTPRDLDVAAQLLFDAIVAEAKFHAAGHDFLDAAAGIDRGVLVHHAALRLRDKIRNKDKFKLDEAKAAVWRSLEHVFGWTDVSSIEPRGNA